MSFHSASSLSHDTFFMSKCFEIACIIVGVYTIANKKINKKPTVEMKEMNHLEVLVFSALV